MTLMNYEEFKLILNKIIFEKSKADLLEKIATFPSRYVGLFRPTKPRGKILQNLLQSHEIRFGNAFEEIIENYLRKMGFMILEKIFVDGNDIFHIDQCFTDGAKVYFLEQKIRDDHDSSKKRGQIANFEKKLNVMLQKHPENNLAGIFYFLDPNLVKNKSYYEHELKKMEKDYKVEIHIFYGGELFDYLKYPEIWQEILEHLFKWKKEIPDMPEINFDANPENTFEEIKNLKPLTFRNLLTNDVIFNEILCSLFPEKKTLIMLKQYFKQQKGAIYKRLLDLLETRIQ